MQPRRREVRGLLREAEDRVLPRLRLGRGHDRGVHGDARRLPQMVQGCQDKGRPGLQEPHAVPQGLGSAGSVGWIRSRITTAVPMGNFSVTVSPRQRGPLRAQGVPREVPGRLDQEAARLPHVVQVAARGEETGRPARRDQGAHVLGAVPPHLEGARGGAVSLPSRDVGTNWGLTQPKSEKASAKVNSRRAYLPSWRKCRRES